MRYREPIWGSDDEAEREPVRVPEGAEEVFRVEHGGEGTGAPAGADRAVKRGKRYWAVSHLAGADGPFNSLAEAISESGIGLLTSHSRRVWTRPGEITTRDLLDALEPMDDELTVEINGKGWRSRAGGWGRTALSATPPARPG